MAEELISSYIDQAAIKAQTDFFLSQLATLKSKYDEVNNIQISLKGANNTKELVSALSGITTVSNQVIDAQIRLTAATQKYDEIQKNVNATTKEKAALSKSVIDAQKLYAEAVKTANIEERENLKTAQLREQQSAKNTAAAEKEAAALAKRAAAGSVDVPFTHNLNADGTVIEPTVGKTTGSIVTDVEKAQVQGIISANEYAAAQKGVSASFVESQSNAKKYEVTQKEIDLALAQDKLSAQKRTAELKNQVREETAVKGSIEQRRAALIRLNTVYDNLSPQERNSAAGQRLQKITKGVTDQLKELEAASGRAQRNVGNYPTNSFNGLKAQLKDVTDQYNNLTKAEQKSAAGKELKTKMDELGKSVKSFGETSSVSFSKAYSGLRILANIIPGLGISGIFLLAGQAIASTVQWIKEAATKVVDFAEKMKTLSEVNLKAIESFGQQRSHIEGLTAVIKDGNISLDDKQRALKDLIELDPKYLSGLTLANINTREGKKILEDYNVLLKRKAELEAATAVQGDASKEVYKLEVIKDLLRKRLVATKTNYDDLTEEELKYVDKVKTSTGRINFTASLLNLEVPKSDIQEMLVGVDKELTKAGKKVTASLDVFKDKFTAVDDKDVKLGIVESLKKQIADLDKQIDTETVKAKISGLVTARKDLQKQLDDLLGKEHSTKSAKDVKTLADVVGELRKELATLSEEEGIGRITPKEADIDRVKAYDKAFKGLFDLKANASTPIVKQLVVEVSPISQRVLEAQIHDLVGKIKPEKIEYESPLSGNKAQRELIIKNTSEQIQKITNMEKEGYVHDLENLNSYLKAGYISETEYNDRVNALKKEHGQSELDNSIALTEAIISNLKARSDGTKEAADQIAEYESKLNDLKAKLYEQDVKNDEKANKEKIKNAEKLAKAKAEMGKLEVELAQDAALLLSTLVTSAIENQIRAVETLESTQQTNYDRQVQRINDSTLTEEQKSERLKILEKERQEQKVQNDGKERELNIKRAKFERLENIAKTIAATASAEVQALTYLSNPITAPLYPGIAALIGAIGSIQLATILATPLPKYKHGKFTDYSGPAYVGDGGVKEVIVRDSGKVEITPDVPTLTWVGQKDKVYPNVESYAKAVNVPFVQNGVEEKKAIVKTVNNAKTVNKYSNPGKGATELKIHSDIKVNNEAANNDKLPIETRLNALNSLFIDRKTLLNAEYEYYKSLNKNNSIELLHKDYEAKLTALTISHSEKVLNITLKAIEGQKVYSKLSDTRSADYVEKITTNNKELQQGLISVTEYESIKEKADREYNNSVTSKIELLKEMQAYSNITHSKETKIAVITALKIIENTFTSISKALTNTKSLSNHSIGALEISSLFFNPLPVAEKGKVYAYDVKNLTSNITKNRTDKIITSTTYNQNELSGLFKENTRELKKVHKAIKGIPQPRININAKHDPNFKIWVDRNVKGR